MTDQCVTILAHSKNIGPITPLEAQEKYGCMRLGARIYDLKQAGVVIDQEIIATRNRFGRKVRVAQYSMHNDGGAA